MVRQYIGARYVPKFYENSAGTAEWRSGVIYEPLTIVTYNGNSYTSKKAVPAETGNPSSNPAYWAPTGLYNAQVEQLRQQVETDSAKISRLETYHADKVIMIGDSYANPSYGNWEAPLQSYLGLSNDDCMKLYRDGVSFFDGGFLDVITDGIENLTAEEKQEYGKVIVLAGLNDAQTVMDTLGYDTIRIAIGQFCSFVKANLPNAKVYLGFIGNSVETSGILMGRNWQRIPQALAQWARCGEFGANFISGLEYVLHDYSLMRPDGIHPTFEGGEQIAKYAASALINGQVDIKRRWRTSSPGTFYDSTDATAGMTLQFLAPQFNETYFDFYQDNGITHIELMARIALTFEEPIEFTLGKQLILGKYDSILWSGKAGVSIPVSGSLRVTDNNYMSYKGHIINNSGTWYLRMDQAGDNWNTHPTVSQVLILPFKTAIPTMMA